MVISLVMRTQARSVWSMPLFKIEHFVRRQIPHRNNKARAVVQDIAVLAG